MMNFSRKLLGLAATLAILTGGLSAPVLAGAAVDAAVQAPVTAEQAVKEATPATEAHAVGTSDYKLDAADRVRVIVFNEPTLSGEFVVGDTGLLSFPLIGDVAARGLTPGQLTREIERKLADGYLVSPRVSIDVLTYRPFYILGEVVKPGEYPYSSALTVVNAVAQAGGFTFRANKKKVYIRKSGEKVEHEYQIASDFKVNAGDTIRIGEKYF